MTAVLRRRGKLDTEKHTGGRSPCEDRERDESDASTAKERQNCRPAPEAGAGAWNDCPSDPPEGPNPADTCVLVLWPLELLRKYNSVVFNHPVCGTVLQHLSPHSTGVLSHISKVTHSFEVKILFPNPSQAE